MFPNDFPRIRGLHTPCVLPDRTPGQAKESKARPQRRWARVVRCWREVVAITLKQSGPDEMCPFPSSWIVLETRLLLIGSQLLRCQKRKLDVSLTRKQQLFLQCT